MERHQRTSIKLNWFGRSAFAAPQPAGRRRTFGDADSRLIRKFGDTSTLLFSSRFLDR